MNKTQLRARESGAIVRGVPGNKFRVNNTDYFIFLPYSIGQCEEFKLGSVTLQVSMWPGGRNYGKVVGKVPESWFIDLNADVEVEEEVIM